MQKAKWLKHASSAAIAVFAIAALVGVFLLKHYFHGGNTKPKKMIQQITVVTPPPPPPPPPEKIKPLEQKEEIKKAERPLDKPQPTPNKSPAPQQDANASGAGPTIAAGSGGGIGSGFGGGYDQFVRQQLNEWVIDDKRLKHLDYVAMVTLKIGTDGSFEGFDVEIMSGDKEAADLIKKLLKEKQRFAKPRPLEAASLVKLRIKSVL